MTAYCSNCGTPRVRGALFCPACGVDLRSQDDAALAKEPRSTSRGNETDSLRGPSISVSDTGLRLAAVAGYVAALIAFFVMPWVGSPITFEGISLSVTGLTLASGEFPLPLLWLSPVCAALGLYVAWVDVATYVPAAVGLVLDIALACD